MRILLTNHHLETLAGSELLTFEIAKQSQQLGHHVSVFTFLHGQVAENIERLGIRVFDTRHKEELQKSVFDVIHCVHWPTYLYLQRLGIELPTVFGFLGILPALENPPPLIEKQAPFWWGVSEEVIENVANLPGWKNRKPMEPIRNWATENKTRTMSTESKNKQVFGVVSNHFPEKYKEYLIELSLEMNFELRFLGLPDNPQPINLETLLDFDAVITLGRTAITAICNGIPVLVLDQNGMDGWVTPDNYKLLRKNNFSGRTNAYVPTKESLRSAIQEKPDQKTTIKLLELATPEHDLPTRVGQVISLCQKAHESKSITNFTKSEFVALEYLDRSFHFESQQDALLSEREALLSEREAILSSTSWKLTELPRRMIGPLKNLILIRGRPKFVAQRQERKSSD